MFIIKFLINFHLILKGRYIEIHPDDYCKPLPRKWWDKVSSLDFVSKSSIDRHKDDPDSYEIHKVKHNSKINKSIKCIVLYSREDCNSTGGRVKFFSTGQSSPFYVSMFDFGPSWFNDKARSYKACLIYT